MPQAQSRAASSQVRSCLFDGFVDIPVRAGQGGSQSEKKACHDCSYTCKEDDAAINRCLLDSRYARGYPSDYDIQPERCHEQPSTGADESEDCTFDQGLPDQQAAPRADCCAKRHLPASRLREGQQTLGDAAARQQQQNAHGRQQQEQSGPYASGDVVLERHDDDAKILVRGGILQCKVRTDVLHLRAPLFDRAAGLEAGNHPEVATAALSQVGSLEHRIDIST